MNAWTSVPLGEICSPAERYTAPAPGVTYRQLGVRLWGEGAYEREQIDGAETKYPVFNRIDADDLVLNKIWARNGAVALASWTICWPVVESMRSGPSRRAASRTGAAARRPHGGSNDRCRSGRARRA